jgi:hypothetical protein
MATGDQDDMLGRLLTVVPARWFPALSPVLTALLSGLAAGWAAMYAQIAYLVLQTRVATATGSWLDGVSWDFFGGMLPRLVNETDAQFSLRIRQNFFAPKVTRAAVAAALFNLTGREPWIFEPRNTSDSGGYGSITHPKLGGSRGYSVAGGYGNLLLPFQEFIVAYRPVGQGIAVVTGYGTIPISTQGAGVNGAYGTGTGGTGYNGGSAGAIEYGNLSEIVGQITDADIYAAAANTLPAGNIAWMAITN